MSKKKLIIIIVAVVVVIGGAVGFWYFTKTNDELSQKTEYQNDLSVQDNYNNAMRKIYNNTGLSNNERLSKIIEVMEEYRAKFEVDGNQDKVIEIDANLSAMKNAKR